MKRPEIKISIPDNLKVQLVDDWEAITKNQQVCRSPPVCSASIVFTPSLHSSFLCHETRPSTRFSTNG